MALPRPLLDRVLVQKRLRSEKTVGGIFIPDCSRKETEGGRGILADVILVGDGQLTPGRKLHPHDVQPGDVVVLSKYSGTAIKHEGVEYHAVNAKDILAVVSDE